MASTKVLSVVSLVFSMLFIPLTSQGGERPILAVFGIEDRGTGLDPAVLENLTTYLTTLVAECRYQVIPRDEIRQRLLEQKKESFKECYDQKCQIELGRELAAQKTLSTKILKLGDRCQLTSMLYDLKSTATDKAASVDSGCDEAALIKAVKSLAGKICRPVATISEDEGGVGILLIKTAPTGALVKLNGKDVGISPVTLRDLDAGQHVVEAEKGGLKGKQTVRVRGGGVVRVILPLTAGDLVKVTLFTEPAEAQVIWDGKDLGSTPVVIPRVRPGKHKVKFSAMGYLDMEKELTINATQELNFGLFSAKRKLRLITEPSGAELFLGKQSLGRAPLEVTLAAGAKHILEAVKEDYLRTSFEVSVQPALPEAAPQIANLALKPRPVVVRVKVFPMEARVTVGGVQGTGASEINVTPGKRKVKVVLDGYQTIEKEMDVPVGQSSEINLQLKPHHAFLIYENQLVSKHWQSWGTLALGIVAAGGSVGLFLWANDSRQSADDAYANYQRALDQAEGQAYLDDARFLDDEAQRASIGAYSCVGVAALAMGWSIYSFMSTPERPTSWTVAPVASESGGQVVLGGRF